MTPKWHPTSLLAKVIDNPSDLGKWLTFNEYISITGMLLIMWVATFWYIYKNKKWYITDRNKVLIRQLLPAAGFFLAFIWILQPEKMLPDNQTVIKGVVPETADIREIYLLDGIINDTLQTIAVSDKKFHLIIKEKMPLKTYRLAWKDQNGITQKQIIFSDNDIVEVQFKDNSKNQPFKILGTRLAENNLAFNLSVNYRLSEYYVNRASSSDAKHLIKTLKERLQKRPAGYSLFSHG